MKMTAIMLPDDLWISLFTEWIDIRELCFLDNAICNKKGRSEFLWTVASIGPNVHFVPHILVNMSYLRWVHRRKIYIECIALNQKVVYYRYLHKWEYLRKVLRLTIMSTEGAESTELFHDIIPCCIHLKFLQLMNVQSTTLVDLLLRRISLNCPELEYCEIFEGTLVTDESVIHLASGCQLMNQVTLKECSLLTDKAIVTLAQKCGISITSLDFTQTSGITDSSLIMISQWCITLKVLCVSGCYLITDAGVNAIMRKCRRLTELNVSHCRELKQPFDFEAPKIGSPSSITSNIDNFSSIVLSLRILDLGGCEQMDDKSVGGVADHCPNLGVLSLAYLAEIHDSSLVRLTRNCILLSELNLRECVGLTNVGLETALMHCPRLIALILNGCCGVTDNVLKVIGKHCKQLELLSIADTMVTDCGFTEMILQLPKLRVLDFGECENLTVASIEAVGDTCKQLTKLGLAGWPWSTEFGAWVKCAVTKCVCLRELVSTALPELVLFEIKLLNPMLIVIKGDVFVEDYEIVENG